MRASASLAPATAWARPAAPPVGDAPSWLVAGLAAVLLVAVGLVFVERLAHWFVAPVLVCGVIVGRDAVEWIRGRVDLLDPAGVVGVLGVHLFFLAPLLHTAMDVWMPYVEPPPDWRDWLGWMAVLNVAGLILYRSSRSLTERLAVRRRPSVAWLLNRRRCWSVFALALGATVVVQALVYRLHGGILGYAQAAAAWDPSFEGLGWLLIVCERFPILLMLVFALLARDRERYRRWRVLVPMLMMVCLCQFLFGGLRGSRSLVVWTMFWAVGIVHVWIRPLPRRAVALCAVTLVVFMYGYGLYKGAGPDALQIWTDPALARDLEEETGRTLPSLLLGDLGRSDVQAYLLFRLSDPEHDVAPAWGRTYAGGVSLLVPRALWPDRPPTKEKEGTDALFGRDAYEPGVLVASNVYGLAGESMLNFGPVGPLAAFALFGAAIGLLRGWFAARVFADLRWLLYPFLVNACVVALVGDSDNLIFFLVGDGLLPITVLVLSARGWQAAPAARAAVARGHHS